MENNDGYIVEIVKSSSPNKTTETRYYYKDGKLHREKGPAIVHQDNKEKFTNLGDEQLYKEIYLETGIGAYKSYFRVVDNSLRIRLFPHNYYLEGKGYSEIEFIAKQLDKEMSINKAKSKKSKI